MSTLVRPTVETPILLTFVAAVAPLGVTVKVVAADAIKPLGKNSRVLTLPELVKVAIPEGADVTESTRSPVSTEFWVAPSSTNTIQPVPQAVELAQLVPLALEHTTILRDDLMASERASCRLEVSARVALSRRHWRRVSLKLGMAKVAKMPIKAIVTINSIKVKPCWLVRDDMGKVGRWFNFHSVPHCIRRPHGFLRCTDVRSL